MTRASNFTFIPFFTRSRSNLLLAFVTLAFTIATERAAHAQLQLVPYVTSGITAPVEMVQDPVSPSVRYVVEQAGKIKVVKDGLVMTKPFLDLTAVVNFDRNEQGLLSLAFAPDYATSGRFFVYFNSQHGLGDCVLARFTRSAADPLVANPDSRLDFEWSAGHRYIEQPTNHHKGGRMQFGPNDGYLYIALGDGGVPADPANSPQDPHTLLGKMLRIDVNVDAADPKGYRIPPDNPFVGPGNTINALPEIWSFGFRNPWRYSFDDPARGGTGALIIGDVGQSSFEEIDYEPAGRGGRNYGWSAREGAHAYITPPATVAFTPLTDPIYDYGRTVGGTVIGGYVYRGSQLDDSFRGMYFFADYLTQRLFAFTPTIDPNTHEALTVIAPQVLNLTAAIGGSQQVGPVVSIDIDSDGELYLVRGDGKIYRIMKSDLASDADRDGLPDNWERQFGLDPTTDAGDDGPEGDPDDDGVTNMEEYLRGTHPRGMPQFTRYFAEGSNSLEFFETTIDLANPGTEPALVLLRFLKWDGSVVPYFVKVDAQRHVTIATTTIAGVSLGDFSTVIESDHEIVAERTMVWTPTERYGSHTETAVKAPSTTWYLAEGATHGAFSLFYLLENANDLAAQVEITYLLPAPAVPIVRHYTIEPHSRRSISVDDEPGLGETDVSAIIRSINVVPIIAERAMYFSTAGIPFRGGHDSAGVTAPNRHWFFAEGATGVFFDMFLLLENPDPQETAHVTLSYLLPDGTLVPVQHDVEPNSRRTYNVQFESPLLESAALSTIVDSDVPIIAERSMYWPKPFTDWAEAHNSPGATETGTMWAVAGGEEGGPFGAQTFVLVANTSNYPGKAKVMVLLETGDPLTQEFDLPPNSRTNVQIGATPGFEPAINTRFGVVVESVGDQPAQIVIERATYSNDAHGIVWSAGAATLGTKLH
jgi:glucose/arabinose dehydrogenase